MKKKTTRKDQNVYPPGWDAARVRRVLDHYENQTEDEAAAEDDAAYADGGVMLISVPIALAPVVKQLIAKHRTAAKSTTKKSGTRRRRAA